MTADINRGTGHWTKKYPKAAMVLSPLSALVRQFASFPQLVLETNPKIHVVVQDTPYPIHESELKQLYSLLAIRPSRAEICTLFNSLMLNPSLLQFNCNDEPLISVFHALRPALVARNVPPAITLYSELASQSSFIPFVMLSAFIPRHIFVKGVFQQDAGLLSLSVNPSSPF